MTLDELLVKAEASVIGAQRLLRQSLQETGWAVEDLRGLIKMPELPPGRTLESCLVEIAARTVLPNKMPEIREQLCDAIKVIDEIIAAVPPIPQEKKS